MITACSHCGSKYELPDKMLGRQARCKACSKMFLISFLADDATPVPDANPTPQAGRAQTPKQRTGSARTRRPDAPKQTRARREPIAPPESPQPPESPESDDPLDALASAAAGEPNPPPPTRPATRQPARDPRAADDQDRPARTRKARGAGAAMGTGIDALGLAAAAAVCGLITMLAGDNQALITALGSTTIILAVIATALGMVAVVNGTSATSRIRRARHPLAGRSQASTGSITGSIALLLVVALVIAGSIWLINRGGLNFQETYDAQGNPIAEVQNDSTAPDELYSADPSAAVFAGSVLAVLLVSLAISLVAFIFWLWMLIDCCQKSFPGESEKIVWILVIVLTGAIGALIYLLAGRPKGQKGSPRRRV